MTATRLSNVRLWGHGDDLQDLVVRDGRIASITPAGALDEAGAEELDLDGRWVSPGLWDHHVHVKQAALVRQRLDVSHAASPAEVVALVRDRLDAQRPPSGAVLAGYGFRDALWSEPIEPGLLDAIADPVALISADLHCLWANRAGFLSLGVEPPDDRLLREQDAFAVHDQLGTVDDRILDAWVAELASAAAARGVVGVRDFDFDHAPDRWTRWYATGIDTLRVRAAVYPDALDDAIAAGRRTGAPLPGSDGLGEVGPFKVIVDGSLNTRTAWCHDPYPGHSGPGAAGQSAYDLAELVGVLGRAADGGFEAAVHAIGDRAAQLVLDAYTQVGIAGSMEHAQLLTTEDVGRLASLGVVASVQPEHAMDDRDVADQLWAGRTQRAFALADLSRAGVPLLLGSDAPVAPLDPWVTMAAAVFRSRDGREPWHPEQRLTLAQARAASAPQPYVTEGGVADLVVLDADPDACDEPSLRTMPVAATMLAGRWTYRAV